MTPEFQPFRCAECGGRVELARGPGRTSTYRVGVDLAVPEDFEIPTCTECDEQYLTAERGLLLAEAQAPLYGTWQREYVRPLIQRIQDAHGVTLRQIEEVCAVSRTYLSHVVNGSKDASRTLLNLLEAYAREPQEFQRKLHGQPWNAPRPCWPLGSAPFSESAPTFREANASGDVKGSRARIVVPTTAGAAYSDGQVETGRDAPANDLVA